MKGQTKRHQYPAFTCPHWKVYAERIVFKTEICSQLFPFLSFHPLSFHPETKCLIFISQIFNESKAAGMNPEKSSQNEKALV